MNRVVLTQKQRLDSLFGAYIPDASRGVELRHGKLAPFFQFGVQDRHFGHL